MEEFQATGPVCEKACSPNFDLNRGVTYNVNSADSSQDRVALPATVRTQSAMYAGHLSTCMECMMEHSLNWDMTLNRQPVQLNQTWRYVIPPVEFKIENDTVMGTTVNPR